MNPLVIIIGVVVILVIVIVIGSASQSRKAEEEENRRLMETQVEEKRRQVIYAKYGHTENAERILSKTVWIGETREQLLDSLGPPLDIDEKVLKTKKKEVWKYVHKGGNRYGMKFTLENDIVVGWNEKM